MREINLIDVFRKVLSRLINNIINLALTFSDSHSTMFPTFTLIFALVSKSVDRISIFALIKKLGKKIKNFRLGCQGVRKFSLEKKLEKCKKIC